MPYLGCHLKPGFKNLAQSRLMFATCLCSPEDQEGLGRGQEVSIMHYLRCVPIQTVQEAEPKVITSQDLQIAALQLRHTVCLCA